jgi:hypothetical protein
MILALLLAYFDFVYIYIYIQTFPLFILLNNLVPPLKYSLSDLLVCDWLHFDWTKSLMCKDAFQQGFHYSEVFQKILHCLQVRDFGSLPAVRTTCYTVRTSFRLKHLCSDEVVFHPDTHLYQEASVPACIRSDENVRTT